MNTLKPIEETMHTRRTTGTMQIEDEQMINDVEEQDVEMDQVDDDDTRIVDSPSKTCATPPPIQNTVIHFKSSTP